MPIKKRKPVTEETRKRLSEAHIGLHAGEKHPNWRGGKSHCIDCGKLTSSRSSLRCKECYNKTRYGAGNPFWKGGKPKCIDCGILLAGRYSKRCVSCCKNDEWKRKQHESRKGRKRPHRGIPSSEEKKAKLSLCNKGRRLFPSQIWARGALKKQGKRCLCHILVSNWVIKILHGEVGLPFSRIRRYSIAQLKLELGNGMTILV